MRNLMISYGIAIACSVIGVTIGLVALYTNGSSHDTSFIAVLATTRNPILDEMVSGYSMGASPIPDALSKQKLRFGVVNVSEIPHPTGYHHMYGRDSAASSTSLLKESTTLLQRACFGWEEQVQPLRKGQNLI